MHAWLEMLYVGGSSNGGIAAVGNGFCAERAYAANSSIRATGARAGPDNAPRTNARPNDWRRPASGAPGQPAPGTQPGAPPGPPPGSVPGTYPGAPPAAPPAAYYPPPAVGQPAQGYAVMDPSTGQIMLVPPYGSAPQRTAPSELPYVEGGPVPRGYAVDEYHPRGLIIGGAVTLGTLYAISLSVAAGGNFDSSNGWLAVQWLAHLDGWRRAKRQRVRTRTTFPVIRTSRANEPWSYSMVLDRLPVPHC